MFKELIILLSLYCFVTGSTCTMGEVCTGCTCPSESPICATQGSVISCRAICAASGSCNSPTSSSGCLCGPGTSCDTANSWKCIPECNTSETYSCGTACSCPVNLECSSSSSGTCYCGANGDCTVDCDCNTYSACDSTAKRCKPKCDDSFRKCGVESDNCACPPPKTVCDNNVCVTPKCTTTDDCSGGSCECNSGDVCDTGGNKRCKPQCAANADCTSTTSACVCGAGTTCDTTGDLKQCKPQCAANADCTSTTSTCICDTGKVCDTSGDKKCKIPKCTSANDCTAGTCDCNTGESCDTAGDKRCKLPTCAENADCSVAGTCDCAPGSSCVEKKCAIPTTPTTDGGYIVCISTWLLNIIMLFVLLL